MKNLFLLLLVVLATRVEALTFHDIRDLDHIYLYAGNISPGLRERDPAYEKFVGISLNLSDAHHIRWDVTKHIPLSNNSVDIYQAEDVFEHIEYGKLKSAIDEIYRVLKPGGFFRLSIPDYRCDVLINRSQKNAKGEIIFDPGGGGKYKRGKVIDGGHVWFPKIEIVEKLLKEILIKGFARDSRQKGCEI